MVRECVRDRCGEDITMPARGAECGEKLMRRASMSRASRILASMLALCLPAQNALGWGEEGHRMVGEIASRYLAPAAAGEIAELLEHDRLADGERSHRRTLGEIASWADEIKDYPWGQARRAWHYDNIPVCGAADRSRPCKGEICASAQLARHVELLRDRTAPIRRRNEALKWVVHLAGDIHQPLHAANHRDQGGNRVEVSFFGQRDNPPYGSIKLHTIWDIHLLQRRVSEKGGERAIVSAPIGNSEKADWERGSISDWMEESNHIARTFVYAALPARFSCGRKISGIVQIDDAYYSKAAPIVEEQIRKAGIRLARILNEALEGQSGAGGGRQGWN